MLLPTKPQITIPPVPGLSYLIVELIAQYVSILCGHRVLSTIHDVHPAAKTKTRN